MASCYGWFVALAVLAGGGTSAYYTQKQPDRFEASTTVVVGPSVQVGNYEQALRGLDIVSKRNVMATYSQVPSSRTVREGVIRELALIREQARHYGVRASILPDTNVIRITVQGPAPQPTADFANSVVRNSQKMIHEIYGGIITFDVLDGAAMPEKAMDPGIFRKIASGALIGLLLALGLAFLIERLHPKHAGVSATNLPEDRQSEPCL
ncbi:MAG: hypothetical protein JXA73_17675 [Acidobacteria bacterium]|nr:hypothetical protein [Acidobacteriota bacterium]